MQRGRGSGRVAETVLRDALDQSVVAAGREGVDAQHGAVRDRHDRVAAVAAVPRRQPATVRPPEVHVGRRVAAGQTDERRHAVVDHLLVARSVRDARRIC